MRKTVLLDSSVWMSLFIQDVHTKRAEKIFHQIEKEGSLIMLPAIIYAEVINNVIRVDGTGISIVKAKKQLLKNDQIQKVHGKNIFWYKRIEEYSKLVRLKTLDLLILAYVFEFKVEKFYSFDERLSKAYQSIARFIKL